MKSCNASNYRHANSSQNYCSDTLLEMKSYIFKHIPNQLAKRAFHAKVVITKYSDKDNALHASSMEDELCFNLTLYLMPGFLRVPVTAQGQLYISSISDKETPAKGFASMLNSNSLVEKLTDKNIHIHFERISSSYFTWSNPIALCMNISFSASCYKPMPEGEHWMR